MLAALLCRDNLPVCGLWILLDMLGRDDGPSIHAPVVRFPFRRVGTTATAIVVLLFVLLDACGLGPQPHHRLGWGIAQELNPQLLDARLLSVREGPLVGWAPDGRSVGIVTWLSRGVTLVDHPQRALIGGRGSLHAALIHDFIGAHRASYRRDDGTWGGWVRQLSDWNVEQLFVPAEQLSLNRALLRSTWKPADLDSPTIPFVSALDPRFSNFVLEALQQQSFVEVGPWQPTAEIYSGQGWRYDFVELLGGGPDPAPAVLQSQLFRSLDIPMASLRALLPVRQQTRHWRLTDEFLACQNDLVYQEWSSFGEAGDLRRLIVKELTGDETPSADRPWLTRRSTEDAAAAEAWRRCVELYLKGRIPAAVQALPLQTSQQHYAAAMLWLELGDSRRALGEFDHLLATSRERAVVVAAKYWRQQLEPFADR